MKYFLIIIALFIQISGEADSIQTGEADSKLNEEKKYELFSPEYFRSANEKREEFLKKERAKRNRVIVKGCGVIPWVSEYENILELSEEEMTPGNFVGVHLKLMLMFTTSGGQVLNSTSIDETILDPLVRSASFKDIEAVKCLLEAGHDPNVKSGSIPYPEHKNTALFAAVRYNSPKIVKLLIKYGADVNEKTKDGKVFLLNKAEYLEHAEIVEILKFHEAK